MGMDEEPDVVVRACTRCSELVESRSQIVNGQGSTDTALLLIGEAPGEAEDAAGVPFVGRSGEILNEALKERGLDRSIVRITNCVRCRPPANRNPRVTERKHCRPYLDDEIDIVDPSVILTLGRVPSEELLDRKVRVMDEVGSVERLSLAGETREVVIGLHPAATLYNRNVTDAFESALERAIELAELDQTKS